MFGTNSYDIFLKKYVFLEVRPREGPAVAAVKVEEGEEAENGNQSKVTLLIVAGGKGSGGTTEMLRLKGVFIFVIFKVWER